MDYCPKCRGIWLDKGELDKLLEHDNKRSSDEYRRYDDDHGHDRHKHQHPRKKKGFLGDFFDFD
ncbi:zf-TFIIB domain-containing protein [Chitinophaga niabensis]|uniref:TFIIB-type zinc ribbon-containing protein n=1 Tax=Chitinophaga niabensis TaxID=536979 RepID=UPI0031B9D03F